MVDILNLALPYFGLIFVGYACGKVKFVAAKLASPG
jgi:malonate transporter and related proteins